MRTDQPAARSRRASRGSGELGRVAGDERVLGRARETASGKRSSPGEQQAVAGRAGEQVGALALR